MSPLRSTLYRTARWVVILAGLYLILAQILPAQLARRETTPKGPRALGLIELAANGKAHLIPIMIMDEGKFYDASAYKASPVPMALGWGTVYEGVRTGVSQGLFTVTAAFRGKDTWIGDGKWQSAAEIAAAASKKPAAASKPSIEEKDAPPVLRRSNSENPKSSEPGSSQPTPQPTPAGTPPAASAPAASAPAASAPATDPFENDPNRPVLRHGKPAPRASDQDFGTSTTAAKTPPPALSGQLQLIPAISDAGGPEPRPYAYSLKPEEEQKFRTRMLALAADEVRARARQLAAETVGGPKSSGSSSRRGRNPASQTPQPSFEDVQLRVFDLSNSNEPILVLTTKARMTEVAKPSRSDLQYYVILVARNDLYGQLHKAFSDVSDSQHLDVSPRFDLIDAVDVDGDGRGELLFRQRSEAGTAFVLYRVIGDRLWPLFQGTPGPGTVD